MYRYCTWASEYARVVAKKKFALAEPAWIQRYQNTGQRTEVIRNIHNTTRVYRRSAEREGGREGGGILACI